MSADYELFSNAVFTSRSNELKDLLSTLFLDIHQSIADAVELRDVIFIDDLKGFPEEMDLAKVAKAFNTSFFQISSLNECIGRSATEFSIGSIYGYIESPQVSRNKDLKKRLKSRLEKKYALKEMDHFSNIAAQIIRWRNVWAHEGGFQNISQGMVLQSNLSLLLKTYPDSLREKIDKFNDYLDFIDNEFFIAIAEFHKSYKEEDIDEEIKRHIGQTEPISDSLSTDISELSEKMDSQISYQTEERNVLNQKVEELAKESHKTNMKLTELSNIMNSLHASMDALRESVDNSSSQQIQDLDSKVEIPIVDVDETQSPDAVSFESQDKEMKPLTTAEVKDKLISLRETIKQDMKSRDAHFQNWHNILMRPLIEELLNNRGADLKQFKDSLIFRHYYNCHSLRGKDSFNSEKKQTQEMMDFQLNKYWDSIEKILKQYKE